MEVETIRTNFSADSAIVSSLHEATLVDGGPENYKKWARRYEADLPTYTGYKSANSKWLDYHNQLLESCSVNKHKVFDAGCGTGLVGENLISSIESDLVDIYGGDLSPDMLEVARSKNIYADLRIINLKEHLPYEAGSFDSIICVGVFIQGHCGPDCLPNLIRVLKKGGIVIATVRKLFFESTKQDWEKQIQDCHCTVEEQVEMPYLEEMNCVVIVMRKL